MVGKMVKLKCRKQLDHLKVQPKPKPRVEEDVNDGPATSSSESVMQEEGVAPGVSPVVGAEAVVEEKQEWKGAEEALKISKVPPCKVRRPESPYLPRKLQCRVVLDPKILKKKGSPGSPEEKGKVEPEIVHKIEEATATVGGLEQSKSPSTTLSEDKFSKSEESSGICEETKLDKETRPEQEKCATPTRASNVSKDGIESKLEMEQYAFVTPTTSRIKGNTVKPEKSIYKNFPSTSSSFKEYATPTSPGEDVIDFKTKGIKFLSPKESCKGLSPSTDKINGLYPGKFSSPTQFSEPRVLNPEEDKEDDIIGSILELEQDEISTPKGSRKGKLPKSPDFPNNPDWVKPEVLLEELWEKKRCLKSETDDPKLFVFPTDPDIVLSPNTWQLPELMALKEELNSVKSSLDHFPLDHWHSHTKKMNIANSIMSYVKRYFNPEFSSQAWGKMFEILCAYEVIPTKIQEEMEAIHSSEKRQNQGDKVPFDSVHLCEAPGAFISALNHFLRISYSYIDWNWLATTLNPYHESNDVGKMINDDRLILMSLDKWSFLEDKTGNILSNTNLEALIKEKDMRLDKTRLMKCEERSVYLVTADGSIDCQTNPGEQEAMVTHLQFGEIISALMILEEGGTFVLKIFTFLEAATICHLYLLSCVFKEVHLFKPATSKEGNSEVYVVCLDFLGKDSIESILESKLIPSLETYDKLLNEGKLLLSLSSIPEVFIDRIKDAARFFCKYQMKVVKRNISCFPCDTRMYLVMKPFRKEAAEQWIEWNEIKALKSQFRLFTGDSDDHYQFRMTRASHVDVKKEVGCFNDKVLRQGGTDIEKIQAIKTELLFYDDWKGPQNQVIYGSNYKVGPIDFERPYKNIRCSRFCYGKILSCREDLRNILNNYLTDLQAHGLGNMESVCCGHAIRRVYESMTKSCDVQQKDLDVLCFSKLTWDFVTKTDFQHQKADLNLLFQTVCDMGKDRSLFLCRFPMLTRLQAGFIYCFASVFEKIIIYGDPIKNVVGIMLHKFKGLSNPDDKNMFRCIKDILKVLTDDEFNWPVLQAVSMKQLLEFMPAEFLVRYNILILCQDMLRTINVVECLIRQSSKDTRKYDKMHA